MMGLRAVLRLARTFTAVNYILGGFLSRWVAALGGFLDYIASLTLCIPFRPTQEQVYWAGEGIVAVGGKTWGHYEGQSN